MSKLSILVLCVAVFACAQAVTEEEKKKYIEDVKPLAEECAAKFGTTFDDVKKNFKEGKTENIEPCMVACYYKKVGAINDDGQYVPENSREKVEKYLSSQEDKDKFNAVITECSEVNNQEVTDGKEGCQRAKLLAQCLTKHKSDELPL